MLTRLRSLAIAVWARAFPVLFLFATTFALVLAPVAFAQDALTVAAPADPTSTVDALAADPVKLAQLVIEAVNSKNWGLLVSLIVTALVWATRRFVPESTKVGQFLRSRLGGLVTNFAFVTGGAFITLFIAHREPTAALVWQTLDMVLKAAGGWAIIKNMMDAMNDAKAQKAGAEAATTPPAPSQDPLNK